VPDEPVPPAKAALAAPVAPSKVAPPATTIAPRPEARPTARAIAETHASERPATEKRAGSSRREAVSHKAKPQRERRAKHARAVAMHQPAAKRATPAPAAPSADPRQPYERGNALLFAGDGKGALAAYREAVKSAPSDPIGFRGLGLAYEQQGEHALAIRALRRYLKLAPDAPDRELIAKRIDKLSKRAKK
jgi:Flp pilus assembly protein TadD